MSRECNGSVSSVPWPGMPKGTQLRMVGEIIKMECLYYSHKLSLRKKRDIKSNDIHF